MGQIISPNHRLFGKRDKSLSEIKKIWHIEQEGKQMSKQMVKKYAAVTSSHFSSEIVIQPLCGQVTAST